MMQTEKTDPAFAQNTFDFICSLEIPDEDALSSLLSLLADPDANDFLCVAALAPLRRAGQKASMRLWTSYAGFSDADEKLKIRFSYALAQIPETDSSVFEILLQSTVSRVRQNAVLGLRLQNSRQFDSLLFAVLCRDPDPETVYEAAVSLAAGGSSALPYLQAFLAQKSRQKPYIPLQTTSEESPPADVHVTAKVIEICGLFGNSETLPYLRPYLSDADERIANAAAESIEKIKSRQTENG